MNDQRPTRWPCSADSSRNAGSSGSRARSLRNADTGVSQSSTNVALTGIRLCERASDRASSSDGVIASEPERARAGSALGATAIEYALGVGEAALAAAQQDEQVVDDVGGLFVDALRRLLARGARGLLGLLHDLRLKARGIVEQLDGVGARWPLARALCDRALELAEHLARRGRRELAAVKARALARVARGPRGFDEREQRVTVAVDAQRLHRLRVAARFALAPE